MTGQVRISVGDPTEIVESADTDSVQELGQLRERVQRQRELMLQCIAHLEDCSDTWTPTDPLLRALKLSLREPAMPRTNAG